MSAKNSINPVQVYLNEADNFPRLTLEDEQVLLSRIKKGDTSARNELVEAHLLLVVTIAGFFVGRGVPFEDLISEGNMGLLKATDKYNSELFDTPFGVYSSFWIKSAMRAAIKEHNKLLAKPEEVLTDLASSYDPITEEPAHRISITEEILLLRRALPTVEAIDFTVLETLYGLNGQEDMGSIKAGRKLKMSHQRINQRRARGLQQIANVFAKRSA